MVVLDGFMWLVGGLDAKTSDGAGDTWFSKNGIWQKTKKEGDWVGREDHSVIVFKNKIFVIGGMSKDFIWLNDIWHTEYTSINNE